MVSRRNMCLCTAFLVAVVSANLVQSESAESSCTSSELTFGKNLRQANISSGQKAVQIYPQKANLKLRKNQEHRIIFQYLQTDFPVDLYYVINLSKSMEDDKENLENLGRNLAETLPNVTSSFRLGFGSFANNKFKNHLSLSANTAEFIAKLKNIAVSENSDTFEGGLNALMQSLVCRQNIGWRDSARRVIVFATDSGLVMNAGDVKSDGANTPNDGNCHLNSNGEYTHPSTIDQPTISQINSKVIENAINIIFAVTPNQNVVYTQLSRQIEGSYIATLSEDSSNVIELGKDQYNRISSYVEMKDNAPSGISVKYYSSCIYDRESERSRCYGLKSGDIASFQADIAFTECPSNPKDWSRKFQIYPIGVDESLTIDLEMLCNCP